jgi:protein-disulfide isomerase
MKRFTLIAAGLVLSGCGMTGDTALQPMDLPDIANDNQALVELAQGVTMGDPNAPITLVEFADFQCPGCAGFASMMKPQIDLAYIESGQAKFVFYDFPLIAIHPHAFLAARAARCAGDQELFWQYHNALFRYQSRWSLSASPPIDLFEDYAAEVGLDQGAFASCLRSDRHAETVTANMILGEQLGVTGTPSVMVSSGGGMARQIPANSFEAIQDVVTGLLAEAGGNEASEGSQP